MQQERQRDRRFYWELFVATLGLSAFTIGGGFVMLSLMRRQFVVRRHWLDEKALLDLAAIAQSAPGSIAVNAALLLGYRLAGMRGVLVSVAGTVLPPLVILSLLSAGYTAFRTYAPIGWALHGMQAGVAALLLDVALSMGKQVLAVRRMLLYVVLFVSLVAMLWAGANAMLVIAGCAGVGVVDTFCREWRRARERA